MTASIDLGFADATGLALFATAEAEAEAEPAR
jgi:hypothetical protein